MEQEFYYYWMGNLPGVGLKRMKKWHGQFGSFDAMYKKEKRDFIQAGCTERESKLLTDEAGKEQAYQGWEELKKKGIQYVSYFDEECYPMSLRELYQPPKHLFVKGKLPDKERLSLAIVGARDCSPYGRDMARMFGYRLACAGINIISGMARGIDGWAHQGALESGGNTYAVLGCGVEVCYPAEHKRLYDSIAKRGGILSEFPIEKKAQKPFFPLRNRIISGLSAGILVVEARTRSGSLITADAALEQGKDVFVIPGRIGDVLSEGCNRLIRQGAIPVLSPKDIITYYGMASHHYNIEETETKEEKKEELLLLLGVVPLSFNDLLEQTKREPADLLKRLSGLKKEKKIQEVSRGYFVRC